MHQDNSAARPRRHKVEPLAGQDISAALSVFDAALGSGFVTESELLGYIEEPLGVAVQAGGGLGVATAVLFPSVRQFIAAQPADMAGVLESLVGTPAGPVGVIKSVAVHPDARRRGLAGCLVGETSARLSALGACTLVSLGWTDTQGCHIEGVLGDAGFTAAGDVNGFWRQDSVVHGYSCPSCGSPCECTARVFSRSVAGGAPAAPADQFVVHTA